MHSVKSTHSDQQEIAFFECIWYISYTDITNLICAIQALEFMAGGGVVVSISDLGLKSPGFDPRVLPKSVCMFVNIYYY